MNVLPAQHCLDTLLDELGLTLLEHQHLLFARAKLDQLIGDQWIGDVEAIDGYIRVTVNVRKALPLQGANDRVVGASAGDYADRVKTTGKDLI